MSLPAGIRISDFDYELPADRIAQRPAGLRDASRLLVWKNGLIEDSRFSDIDSHLPEGSLLVFNDTRVVRARLLFTKPGGALIEIFCLEPVHPVTDLQLAFQERKGCRWSCLVGNSKKWRTETLVKPLGNKGGWLKAKRTASLADGCFEIEFSWDPPSLAFSEVLDTAGQVPLPPYINREADQEDSLRYQTVYARSDGSVAAPTAGLHFTNAILERLKYRHCRSETLTLHVGLGTFRPVNVPDIRDHTMHPEAITVKLSALRNIRNSLDGPLIAVGTTSARTLESLYWLGVKAISHPQSQIKEVAQWDPYEQDETGLPTARESLDGLISRLEFNGLEEFHGNTRLIIMPGYTFRVVNGLITNFHMPQSTLLLLIAAFTGSNWKNAYAHAMANGYRFLSYGDACMFL